MRQSYRWSALFGVCALSLCALSACGGGGASSNSSAAPAQAEYNFSGGGANVVSVSIGPGPAAAADQTFNIPFATVTVCEPGTTTCATINDVLVDTGSSGLRLMASALTAQGLTLTAMADPANSANTIHECLPFADGYAWGAVSNVTVKIGGEVTASAIPVQVIDDSTTTPSPAAPSSCTTYGNSLDSVNAFDANGVLGVASMIQDCGNSCAQQALSAYYTCTPGGSCTATTQALADQVSNPVVGFPVDNNGVILQLPSIGVSGAATAAGYLVFGIGTESNNGLGNAKVFTTDSSGSFVTNFDSQTLSSSFIDSGSNGLFFPSSLALCGQSAPENEFYCPTSTASLTATNQGQNGTSGSVSFQIASLSTVLNNNNYAYDDVGGPATPITGFGGYFDWGLPFFYDRTVFVAVDGASAGGTTGPYYAY